jgi:ribonuclease HI
MADAPLITIHTDGASRGNPGPAAFAYVLGRDGEEPIEEAGRLGRMTNNQAEYTALVRALEHALELGADHRVAVHSDSELLVKQMRGEYRVKNEDLRDLYEEARDLCRRFRGGVTFRHVRREENSRADALGNEALDGLREPTPRASNTPRAAPRPPKPPQPSLREQGVARLRKAAAAWAAGAAEPTPEQVWDELLALLKRHGPPSFPAAP